MADIEIYEDASPESIMKLYYQPDIVIYTGIGSGGTGSGYTPASPDRVYTYYRIADKTRLAVPSTTVTVNRQPLGASSPFFQTPDIAVSEDGSPAETQVFQYQSDIAVSEDESPTESGSISQ